MTGAVLHAPRVVQTLVARPACRRRRRACQTRPAAATPTQPTRRREKKAARAWAIAVRNQPPRGPLRGQTTPAQKRRKGPPSHRSNEPNAIKRGTGMVCTSQIAHLNFALGVLSYHTSHNTQYDKHSSIGIGIGWLVGACSHIGTRYTYPPSHIALAVARKQETNPDARPRDPVTNP